MNGKNFEYLDWLYNDTSGKKTLSTGEVVDIWFFKYDEKSTIMSKWAKHFRNHYCDDYEIDCMRRAEGLSRTDYLRLRKFPNEIYPPGPATRSGDFSEIMIADFLEYFFDYFVPRTRYDRKVNPNSSTQGSDLIGFKFTNDFRTPSPDDELIVYEVKANYTGTTKPGAKHTLQNAVDHSAKDIARLSESLNAVKQRYKDKNKKDEFQMVERFQNLVDRPHKRIFGAAALFSSDSYNPDKIAKVDISNHPEKENLKLLIITGDDMMDLVHNLYRRAADEA